MKEDKEDGKDLFDRIRDSKPKSKGSVASFTVKSTKSVKNNLFSMIKDETSVKKKNIKAVDHQPEPKRKVESFQSPVVTLNKEKSTSK